MGHTIITELVSVAIGLGLGVLFVWLANRAEGRRIDRERTEFAARLAARDGGQIID